MKSEGVKTGEFENGHIKKGLQIIDSHPFAEREGLINYLIVNYLACHI